MDSTTSTGRGRRSSPKWITVRVRLTDLWADVTPPLQGTILRTSAFFSRSYFRQPTHAGHLASFQSKIVVYDGDDCAPRWCRDRHGPSHFALIVQLGADLLLIARHPPARLLSSRRGARRPFPSPVHPHSYQEGHYLRACYPERHRRGKSVLARRLRDLDLRRRNESQGAACVVREGRWSPGTQAS